MICLCVNASYTSYLVKLSNFTNQDFSELKSYLLVFMVAWGRYDLTRSYVRQQNQARPDARAYVAPSPRANTFSWCDWLSSLIMGSVSCQHKKMCPEVRTTHFCRSFEESIASTAPPSSSFASSRNLMVSWHRTVRTNKNCLQTGQDWQDGWDPYWLSSLNTLTISLASKDFFQIFQRFRRFRMIQTRSKGHGPFLEFLLESIMPSLQCTDSGCGKVSSPANIRGKCCAPLMECICALIT